MSISGPKVDIEEVKDKLRQEVEQQTRQMQTIINGLVSENIDLKKRIQTVEAKFASMEKTLGQVREAVSSLE